MALDDNLSIVNEVQEIQPQGTTDSTPISALNPIPGPVLPSLSDIESTTDIPFDAERFHGNRVPGTDIRND